MAGLDRHENKVEQHHASGGEQHLSGARAEVESHQRAQHGAAKGADHAKGGDHKGAHPNATHLEMSNPYEKSVHGANEKAAAAKPADTQKSPAEQTQPHGPSASDIRTNSEARFPVAKSVGPTAAGGSDTIGSGAAKPADTQKSPAEQQPQSPTSDGSAWDMRNQYSTRNQMGKTMSPSEAGGSDSIQDKESPKEPDSTPKWQQRPPEAGDAVTKWTGV